MAVHLYETRLLNFLKLTHQVTKIFYFSDGCAGQYINCKNFLNLCHHKQDFEVDAKWHFFATSHSKGPCNGIGRTVKRLAARASLQRTEGAEPILDPLALNNFMKHINYSFSIKEHMATHTVVSISGNQMTLVSSL